MSRKTPTLRPAAPLRLEGVEDRCVPANFIIANGDVTGLIAALNMANTNNQPDTITLAAGGTYNLTAPDNTGAGSGTNGLPVLALDNNSAANSYTIVGNGATIQRDPTAGTQQFRILAINQATASITGVNFLNGAAVTGGFAGTGDGGAIFAQGLSAPNVTINQCFFSNNSAAGAGGAVAIDAGNATISNSTFDGNSCVGFFNAGGGGLSVIGLQATGTNIVNVVNCTFTNNSTSTGHGGGVATSFGISPTLTFQNTIIANNSVGNVNNAADADLFRSGGTINALNSIIKAPGTDNALINPQPAVNGASTGTVFGADPLLGPLQNNGGSTQTRLPIAGSPALNTGNNNFVVGATDQRGAGFPRVFNGTVDIGAAELQSIPIIPPIIPPPGTTTGGPGGLVTVPVPPGALPIVAGAGAGSLPQVNVFDPRSGALVRSIQAYDPAFTGGVNVAAGDVTGDGVPDIVTAPASDGGADVRIFDGVTGNMIANFLAYPEGFDGGASVAVGDVNGDGRADIVTGAGEGGGPHVRAFSGAGYGAIRDFLAYGRGYFGGVTVAVADFDKDGFNDIVTGTQTGGNHVRVFGGASGTVLANFLVGTTQEVGLSVAAGDVTGDGVADIIVGQRSGGSMVATYNYRTATLQNLGTVYPRFDGGLSVATVDRNGDGVAEIVTGAGPTGGPHVRVLNGTTLDPALDLLAFGGAGDNGANV